MSIYCDGTSLDYLWKLLILIQVMCKIPLFAYPPPPLPLRHAEFDLCDWHHHQVPQLPENVALDLARLHYHAETIIVSHLENKSRLKPSLHHEVLQHGLWLDILAQQLLLHVGLVGHQLLNHVQGELGCYWGCKKVWYRIINLSKEIKKEAVICQNCSGK